MYISRMNACMNMCTHTTQYVTATSQSKAEPLKLEHLHSILAPKLTRHTLWANNLTALALHFLMCKIGMMEQSTRIKCNNQCEVLATVPGTAPEKQKTKNIMYHYFSPSVTGKHSYTLSTNGTLISWNCSIIPSLHLNIDWSPSMCQVLC